MRAIMDDWLALVAGYSFAVIVGHFAIGPIVDRLWRAIGWDPNAASSIRPEHRLPRLVGLVERTLYVASLQFGKAEFIGVWVALKVAGQWKRWSDGITDGTRQLEGRSFYNIFLLGSGLSIGYAAVGAQIIELMKCRQFLSAFVLPIALLLATLGLALVARRYERLSSSEDIIQP